jgi:hypothetical protein
MLKTFIGLTHNLQLDLWGSVLLFYQKNTLISRRPTPGRADNKNANEKTNRLLANQYQGQIKHICNS